MMHSRGDQPRPDDGTPSARCIKDAQYVELNRNGDSLTIRTGDGKSHLIEPGERILVTVERDPTFVMSRSSDGQETLSIREPEYPQFRLAALRAVPYRDETDIYDTSAYSERLPPLQIVLENPNPGVDIQACSLSKEEALIAKRLEHERFLHILRMKESEEPRAAPKRTKTGALQLRLVDMVFGTDGETSDK